MEEKSKYLNVDFVTGQTYEEYWDSLYKQWDWKPNVEFRFDRKTMKAGVIVSGP